VLEQPVLGESIQVTLKVANPLSTALTKCSVIVEGPGLMLTKKITCGDIPSRSIARIPVVFTPWKDGQRTLMAHFRSEQLQDVNGFVSLLVPSHR
jgi:hypothetical protein